MTREPTSPAQVLAPRLPSAPEAESALIGAVLTARSEDADAIAEAIRAVVPADLIDPAARTVWATICKIHATGAPVDLVSVVQALRDAGRLESVGGIEAVARYVDTCSSVADVGRWAGDVLSASRRRRAVQAAEAFVRCGGVNGQAEALRAALDVLEADTKAPTGPRSVPAILAESIELEKAPKIESSIKGMAEIAGAGFALCWLVLVAGYTGAGKTSVLLAEAVGLACRGIKTLYVTLELGAVEIAWRVRAIFAPVPVPGDLPLDVAGECYSLASLIATVEAWAKKSAPGPQAVVIDYAQKIQVFGESARERQVARAAEEIQALGRRLKLVILLGGQLNRESKKAEGGPEIWQVRESGLLEQVADVVFLLDKTAEDKVRIKCGKNRWGRSGGEIELSADWAKCAFGPLTPAQRYGELGRAIREYLQEAQGRAKVRDLTQYVRWGEGHPKKVDILAAEQAVGGFRVIGSEAHLC
jgi:replicative DNA helicase